MTLHWPSTIRVSGRVWYRARERQDFEGEEIRYQTRDHAHMIVRFLPPHWVEQAAGNEPRLVAYMLRSIEREILAWEADACSAAHGQGRPCSEGGPG